MLREQETFGDRYWLMIGDVPTGPLDLVQVHYRLATGDATWETLACRLGESNWLPLVTIPGIGPAPAGGIAEATAPTGDSRVQTSLSVSPPAVAGDGVDRALDAAPPHQVRSEAAKQPATTRSRQTASKGGWGGAVIAFLIAGAVAHNFKSPGKANQPTAAVRNGPPAMMRTTEFHPPAQQRVPDVARLRVSGRDGTGELQQIVGSLTDAEVLALGLGVLLTGVDIYAVRVRLTNTGNVPIRVYPENIGVHFGGESARVTTVNHARFLQRGVLDPGFSVEGLVMYQARIDIGAAMRLTGGGLSYNDDSIEVLYDR